ncbi:MAG: YCF48-related protein [Saprospiraceae bacterium]
MKTSFIIVLIFLSISCYSQCWEEIIIPGYEDRSFQDVQFADSLNGWIIGEAVALRTTDGGNTWEPKKTFPKFDFIHLSVFNKDSLWIWSPGDTLFYSYNNGDDWDYYLPIDERGRRIIYGPFKIVDGKIGWHSVQPFDEIWKTEDGGKTWRSHFSFFNPLNEFNFDVSFFDTQNVWLLGKNVARTIDGDIWDDVTPGTPNNNRYGGIDYLGPDTCILVGGMSSTGICYKSVNNGNTWENIELPDSTLDFWDVSFFNPSYGWSIGRKGQMLYTEDGGEHWSHQDFPTDRRILVKIEIIDYDRAWVVGGNRSIILKYAGTPTCINNINNYSYNDTIPLNLDTITWKKLKGCFKGYTLDIGFSPSGKEILDHLDVGLDTFAALNLKLPEDTTIYVTIMPYGLGAIGKTCSSIPLHTEKVTQSKDLNNGKQNDEVSLYPNPTSNIIHFQFADRLKLNQIEVFSLNGKLQFKLEEIQSHKINMQNLPAGMYTIRFVFEDWVVSRKVLKN